MRNRVISVLNVLSTSPYCVKWGDDDACTRRHFFLPVDDVFKKNGSTALLRHVNQDSLGLSGDQCTAAA